MAPGETPQWTALGVVGNALAKVRRYPFRAFVLLSLVPALWRLPFDVLWPYPHSGWPNTNPSLDQYVLTVARSLANVAWNAPVSGGIALVSIDLARDRIPVTKRFLDGLRYTVRLFAAAAVISFAIPVFGFARWAALFSFPIVQILFVRGFVWDFLIVDRGHGVRESFRQSWQATRGSFWKITRLFFLGMSVFAPLSFIAFKLGGNSHPYFHTIVASVSRPLFEIAYAEVYLLIVPGAGATASSLFRLEPALPHPEDPTISGSGWARDAKRP